MRSRKEEIEGSSSSKGGETRNNNFHCLANKQEVDELERKT